MKKTVFVLLAALVTINTWAVDVAYYNSLDGKSGSSLREAVTSLTFTKHTTQMGYNWVFDDIDIVDGVVLDMYSTCSWTSAQQGKNYNGICDGYNREHTVPQSFFSEKQPQKGDRHHLFLTDGQVNNVRSNYPFGETNATNSWSGYDNGDKALGQFGYADFAYSSSQKVYEPDDQYKGDIARAILYMVVRYATKSECRVGSGTQNDYPVTSWGGGMFSSSLSDNYGLSDAAKQTFLKWHRADPVSKKEIDRNNGVEAKQGNRNPFVDYPCLVEYLWGNHAGESFPLANMIPSFAPGWDGSDGCSGSAPVCTKLATPNVAAVAGNKQVTLTWAVVDGAKNYTVTISNGVGYTTECLTDAVIGTVTISGDVCTCIITGLTNGLVYTTSVKANADNSTCDSDIDQDQVTPEADPTPVTYQIRFLNGETVLQDEMLEAGVLPVYKGATPTKAPDTQYTYTFSKWSPDIAVVTKSQDYAAQFNATPLDPTSAKVIEAPQEQVRKVMINGLLYIQRGDHIYDVTGRLVK